MAKKWSLFIPILESWGWGEKQSATAPFMARINRRTILNVFNATIFGSWTAVTVLIKSREKLLSLIFFLLQSLCPVNGTEQQSLRWGFRLSRLDKWNGNCMAWSWSFISQFFKATVSLPPKQRHWVTVTFCTFNKFLHFYGIFYSRKFAQCSVWLCDAHIFSRFLRGKHRFNGPDSYSTLKISTYFEIQKIVFLIS